MVEPYLRQGPLAHLGLDRRPAEDAGGRAVTMAERPFRRLLVLRANAADTKVRKAVKDALGTAPPTDPSTTARGGGCTLLWVGPDEWLVAADQDDAGLADRLARALAGHHAAVTEVSEARACIALGGARSRDLLAKGCPLDLHPRVFGPGRCASTLFAKANVLIHQTSDEPGYDLYVARSFADYVWRWLEDAALEFGGIAVVEA